MEIPDPELPGIPIDPQDLEILDTPTRFYEKLLVRFSCRDPEIWHFWRAAC